MKRSLHRHVTSGCSGLDQLEVLTESFRPPESQQSRMEKETLEELLLISLI